jgi:hypothetical protein
MGPGVEASTGMEAAKVIRALVTLGDLDLLYADRYRDRAQARCGDGRYGGADGLYAVGRDYGGDHLVARFAVLHRQRFL